MNYIIQINSISVNGRTYRKGDKVSDVRFSESQVKDLLDSKSIAAEPAAIAEPTASPVVAGKPKP